MELKKHLQLNKMKENLQKAELFLKKAFQANPSYSFSNWRIMYEHSVMVKDIAIKIAKAVGADEEIAGLASLLHDIGKTKKISKDRLEAEHQDYNAEVSKPLLATLDLNSAQKRKLVNIILYKSTFQEMKIVKDADAIAFFRDRAIQNAFIKWAIKDNPAKTMQRAQRKIDKFKKLNFSQSRKMARKDYEKLLKDWQPKLNKLS